MTEPDRIARRAPWAPPTCHCPHVEQWFFLIAEKLEIDMAAIDDLTAAVSGLSAEITTFLADVAVQISGGVTAEQVVAQINGFTAQLQGADPANQPAPAEPAPADPTPAAS